MGQSKTKLLEMGGLAFLLTVVSASLDPGWICSGCDVDTNRLIQSELLKAIDLYQIKNGKAPPQDTLRKALEPFYDRPLKDAWDNPILYLHPDTNGGDVVLISAGQDTLFNTADDLVTRRRPRPGRPNKTAASAPHLTESPDRSIIEGCRRP